MRNGWIRCAVAAMICVQGAFGQLPKVTISAVQTFQPASWTATPGEAQSTVIRYARPDNSMAGRILISNDFLPMGSPQFVPTGTVAYQDIGGAIASSTFETPPGCAVSFSNANRTCNWFYLSNDHDLISTSNGTVYYMPGVGYMGPTTLLPTPYWFVGGPTFNTNATYRSTGTVNFGPNARSGLAVWKSTDHGQTFQWSSFFDPANYFNGKCAFPQYRNNPVPGDKGVVGAPWDMGGSDGQAVWADSMTGKIFLTFQCVGYSPEKISPWTLGLTQETVNGVPQVNPDNTPIYTSDSATQPLGVSILASFDGNNWTAMAMPEATGWRMGAIPYNQFLLVSVGTVVMIADTTKPGGALKAAYPSVYVLPQVQNPWPHFQNAPFLAVNITTPTVLTRWGYDGYAFAYMTNNAAPGAAEVDGYTVYYFTLPPEELNGTQPNPKWAQLPTQINPTKTGGFISDVTAIDVGSGTTLLYWYDVDRTAAQVTMRGRLLLQGGLTSNDFAITPTPFSVQNPGGLFWGDYKTAGGYCYSGGQSVTSVYYPMWTDVGTGTAQYAEVSTTVPWTGAPPIAPGCKQSAPTNRLAAGGGIIRGGRLPVPVQLTKPPTMVPGRIVDASTVKVKAPPPDVQDHRPVRKVGLPAELKPKPQ